MGNTYFQFKQFRVEQAGSAMKVCTDACIQGAFTAAFTRALPASARVLDIGAGTGLLSLMLAQDSAFTIDAVELDGAAAEQATANFAASPWPHRLRLHRGDIAAFQTGAPYDFIISNPPFFHNNFRGPNPQRTNAMHTVTLGYDTLLAAIQRLLKPDGQFSVLLPHDGFQRFRAMAEASGYTLQELLEIRQTPRHAPFRAVGIFGNGGALRKGALVIREVDGEYPVEFIRLLRDYYLYLP
ncbi:tRNA1(Val) (adenine(37)-N6)-methyltransferase [Chitinophaga lutea]